MADSNPFLFVSHVSENRAAALEIVGELERRGVPCWIAPRDVRPGSRFDDEISDALDGCRAMLLIFSEHCNQSEYISREVTVAGENHKVIIPFRIEDAQPRRGLRVRLSDLHWIDGFASRQRALDELANTFAAWAAEKAQREQQEATEQEHQRQEKERQRARDEEEDHQRDEAERQQEADEQARLQQQEELRRLRNDKRPHREKQSPLPRERRPLGRRPFAGSIIVTAALTLVFALVVAVSSSLTDRQTAMNPTPPVRETFDPEKVPFVKSRNDVRAYGASASAKALAISASGVSWWSPTPRQALEACEFWAREPCILYAVGNLVEPAPDGHRPPRAVLGSGEGTFLSAAIPFVPDAARQTLVSYVSGANAKALAVSPRGHYGEAYNVATSEEAQRLALERCQSVENSSTVISNRKPCYVYAIGDTVVLAKRLTAPIAVHN